MTAPTESAEFYRSTNAFATAQQPEPKRTRRAVKPRRTEVSDTWVYDLVMRVQAFVEEKPDHAFLLADVPEDVQTKAAIIAEYVHGTKARS